MSFGCEEQFPLFIESPYVATGAFAPIQKLEKFQIIKKTHLHFLYFCYLPDSVHGKHSALIFVFLSGCYDVKGHVYIATTLFCMHSPPAPPRHLVFGDFRFVPCTLQRMRTLTSGPPLFIPNLRTYSNPQ